MKVLLLSYYFKPDLCAGSFRATSLVEILKKKDIEIEIITTAPNRYSSHISTAPQYEDLGNIKIHRISLPTHNSGMLSQAIGFFKFYKGAIRRTKNSKYDLIFATSSRLFTAFLGARISQKLQTPLYLDIRDIFVDTINEVLPKVLSILITPFLNIIEKYTFKSAIKINLVSKGFEDYFIKRFPSQSYSFFSNGIDKIFLDLAKTNPKRNFKKDKPVILYAGNIGEGQGLHNIIPELCKKLPEKYIFRIIGDGGKKNLLKKRIKKLNLSNVEFINPMQRDDLVLEYLNAEILFLHLNNLEAFKKVLPSKIFEYASMGLPILAGVSGFSERFLKEEVSNCAVFMPCDANDALEKIKDLDLKYITRQSFLEIYARDTIMEKLASDILRTYGMLRNMI